MASFRFFPYPFLSLSCVCMRVSMYGFFLRLVLLTYVKFTNKINELLQEEEKINMIKNNQKSYAYNSTHANEMWLISVDLKLERPHRNFHIIIIIYYIVRLHLMG